jgi:hypothetical protein
MADYIYNTEVDMIECAMWWEMPEPGAFFRARTTRIKYIPAI